MPGTFAHYSPWAVHREEKIRHRERRATAERIRRAAAENARAVRERQARAPAAETRSAP